jgi:hypothetical protein
VSPKKMHDALARQAKKKGLTGERKDRYVFGTMAKAKKKKG